MCARTGAKPRARQTQPVSESSSLVGRPPSERVQEAPRQEAPRPAGLCLPDRRAQGVGRRSWAWSWRLGSGKVGDSGQHPRD